MGVIAMVFGLFKSKEAKRIEHLGEEYTQVTRTLDGLDQKQKSAIALQYSVMRLRALSKFSDPIQGAEHDDRAKREAEQIWYRPLEANSAGLAQHMTPFIIMAFSPADNRPAPLAELALRPLGEVFFLTARVLCNTWQACSAPSMVPRAREMWRPIIAAFPHVDGLLAELKVQTDPSPTAEEIAFFEAAVADGPDGPDYRRVPVGFGLDDGTSDRPG